MESDRILEDSKKELERIYRCLGMDSLTINLSRLDRRSKAEICRVLSETISARKSTINSMLTGVK